MQSTTIKFLKYYPIVFLFVWFWAVWRRAWNVFEPAPIWLIALQIGITSLYGTFNAMIYGYIVYHHLERESKNSTTLHTIVTANSNVNTDNESAGNIEIN